MTVSVLFTSGNVDFWIESFRDVITYDRRSSTGISQTFDDNGVKLFTKSSQFSSEPTLLSKDIGVFSKLDCGTWEFGNTRAGILSNIFGRFSCWAFIESSNEYDGGSFQPGVEAKQMLWLNNNEILRCLIGSFHKYYMILTIYVLPIVINSYIKNILLIISICMLTL